MRTIVEITENSLNAIPHVSGFIIVPANHSFTFKKLCPYCAGDLTYTVQSWIEDDKILFKGLFMADNIFDVDCSKMPEMIESSRQTTAWQHWFNRHSTLPYIHQLPVDMQVLKFINEKYRFEL